MTFKKGQKVYRLVNYYASGIEEWTFIRKETERNGGGWILYDQNDDYRTMHNITDFCGDKEGVELYLFKNSLERIEKRKSECYREIENYESDIYISKKQIKDYDREMTDLHKKYEHLIEKYPEEFI